MTSSRLVSAIPRARINLEAAETIRSRVARPLAVLGSSIIHQILGVLDPLVQRLHIFGNVLVRTRVASKDRSGRDPLSKREAGDDFRTRHRHRKACYGAQWVSADGFEPASRRGSLERRAGCCRPRNGCRGHGLYLLV